MLPPCCCDSGRVSGLSPVSPVPPNRVVPAQLSSRALLRGGLGRACRLLGLVNDALEAAAPGASTRKGVRQPRLEEPPPRREGPDARTYFLIIIVIVKVTVIVIVIIITDSTRSSAGAGVPPPIALHLLPPSLSS